MRHAGTFLLVRVVQCKAIWCRLVVICLVHGPFSRAVLYWVWSLHVMLLVRVVTACTGLVWYIMSLVLQRFIYLARLVVICSVSGWVLFSLAWAGLGLCA